MSDLATPLLYIWDGDTMKAFWTFVQIMKLLKKNFEMSQNTISFQLQMLYKLIQITDSKFAEYLKENDSHNCYFAFRWIICLFKREFMKGKTDDYDDCLTVWESVWCINSFDNIEPESETATTNERVRKNIEKSNCSSPNHEEYGRPSTPKKLSNVELYLLSLSLAIIRKERDLILSKKFDACEILKHFNTLHLKENLNELLLNASQIWHWLKFDGGEEKLYTDESEKKSITTEEDFEILNNDCIKSDISTSRDVSFEWSDVCSSNFVFN
ncbi:TBC1 domain family member 15-like protein [Dinothrombium tinctorium]|uniref:TBC1 domain family member 15-like protein n=1 Tax=Dinothrombium tinctorium TaxID=1965070 RepID=A0A3S3RWA8_9ACAR|nr:TBC1 domain family member 15-like protein [Dinothrombium tinctorium]RWS06971.1 TBC1 domain family member 15-like protein [Dinothrombium tinctorium]